MNHRRADQVDYLVTCDPSFSVPQNIRQLACPDICPQVWKEIPLTLVAPISLEQGFCNSGQIQTMRRFICMFCAELVDHFCISARRYFFQQRPKGRGSLERSDLLKPGIRYRRHAAKLDDRFPQVVMISSVVYLVCSCIAH